jgi:hypothetical protein
MPTTGDGQQQSGTPRLSTIPADSVLRLRQALYTQLAGAAEELARAASRPGRERREECAEQVAHLDLVRGLLDAIGWRERDPEPDIALDLGRHRPTIITALREHLDIERDLVDTHNEGQRERAMTNAAAIEAILSKLAGPQAPAPVVIAPGLVGFLRESLMEAFPALAQRIERAGLDADAYAEPRSALDAH